MVSKEKIRHKILGSSIDFYFISLYSIGVIIFYKGDENGNHLFKE